MNTVVTADDSFASNLEICYEVLLYLSSKIAKLPSGGVLEFVTSDPEAGEKIPEWVEQREYELLEQGELPDGRHRFLIRK